VGPAKSRELKRGARRKMIGGKPVLSQRSAAPRAGSKVQRKRERNCGVSRDKKRTKNREAEKRDGKRRTPGGRSGGAGKKADEKETRSMSEEHFKRKKDADESPARTHTGGGRASNV